MSYSSLKEISKVFKLVLAKLVSTIILEVLHVLFL